MTRLMEAWELIRFQVKNEPLAILLNVKADTLTPTDFGLPDLPKPPDSTLESNPDDSSLPTKPDTPPASTQETPPTLPPKPPSVEINPGTVTIGGNQGEWLRGNDSDNFLSGGEGNDTIVGELQQDWLMGNAGEDVFVVQPQYSPKDNAIKDSAISRVDVILDFNPSEDYIAIEQPASLDDFILKPYTLNQGAWQGAMGILSTFKTLGLSYADLKKKILSNDLGALSILISPKTLKELEPVINSSFDPKLIDPDENGILEGVLITKADPGNQNLSLYHGFILNTTVAEIQSRLISI
jgi:RTX calcium-binding nonapeptide repeat (4 copies)